MDNQKLFLYAALAFVGMLIWQQWQVDFGPKPEVPQAVTASTPQVKAEDPKNISDVPDIAPNPADNGTGIQAVQQNTAKTVPAKLISVETDLLKLQIDTNGGVIESVKLKKYPVSIKEKNKLLEIIFNREDEKYVIQSGLTSKNSAAPNHHDLFTTSQDHYELKPGENELVVPLQWQKDGVLVTKTFTFKRDDYLIKLDQLVQNNSDKPWVGSQYRQITRSKPLTTSKVLHTFTGAVYYNEEVKYEKLSFSKMEEKNLKTQSQGGWIAMIQHYFLSAWIANENEKDTVYSLKHLKTYPASFTIGMSSQTKQVSPHSSGSFSSHLFVGPKLPHKLEKISKGLDLTVDYGYLTVLSKPLYWLLETLHSFVGNWGLAIILLTIIIKGAFFKLSETSYRSMAKMRKVGPRLKTLKERYGDDRQKMNQAMMDLYKTEKINPMSGCLPILVQIPVFIALYWALLESVALRQAPFILWIQDLSVADPYYILPVIMGISMLIQQKLNPAPPDPMQAKVMMALPLVFSVFFAFFPAGLVLYWVVNNTISITQQWVITKRIEAEKK